MAAAALLRSASKMARLPSSSWAAGGQGQGQGLLRSSQQAEAGTMIIAQAPAPPPPPYHRLVQGRAIHSTRTSPHPSPCPSTAEKVVDALETATTAVTISMGCGAAYLHFCYRPKLQEMKAEYREQLSQIKNIKLQQQQQYMGASSVSHHDTPTVPASVFCNKPSPSPQQQPGKDRRPYHENPFIVSAAILVYVTIVINIIG